MNLPGHEQRRFVHLPWFVASCWQDASFATKTFSKKKQGWKTLTLTTRFQHATLRRTHGSGTWSLGRLCSSTNRVVSCGFHFHVFVGVYAPWKRAWPWDGMAGLKKSDHFPNTKQIWVIILASMQKSFHPRYCAFVRKLKASKRSSPGASSGCLLIKTCYYRPSHFM